MALPPLLSWENGLLEVGHRGQVRRELGDTGRTAPVRACTARIDRGDVGGAGRVEGAGEGVAVTLRQVGVGVAQVEGEHLVGEADADVPGIVIGIFDAVRERPGKARIGEAGSVERVGGAEPLAAELAGDVEANAAGAECRAGSGVLAGDRRIVAPGARVQEVRRIVLIQTELPVVVDGVVYLAVAFEEADVLFHHVAVGQGVGGAFGAKRVACGVDGSAAETGPTRIEVTPDAEIEGEGAEGRADTAVDVDFGGGAVGKGDALGGCLLYTSP